MKKIKCGTSLLLVLCFLLSLTAGAFEIDLPQQNLLTEQIFSEYGQNDLDVSTETLTNVCENSGQIMEQATLAETQIGMTIDKVEITNAADTQIKYRTDMYLEDGKYYTTFRDASMLDPRNFTFNVTFDSTTCSGIGSDVGQFDVSKVTWWYGDGSGNDMATITASNKPIAGTGSWTKSNFGGSGSTNPIVVQGTPTVVDNGNGTYTLTAVIKFDVCYATVEAGAKINQPYGPYASWTKSGLGTLYTLLDKLDNATLRMVYDNASIDPLASMKFKYNIRDYYYTWKELDTYIKTEVLPRSGNAGDGSFTKPGRYLQMESLGKSTGYNDGNELDGTTPVQRDVWNGVLSDSKSSIDYYQNVVQPTLNDDPVSLLDQLDSNPNIRIPIFFNNIHSDETAGSDAIVQLMKTLSMQEKISFDDANTIQHTEKSGSSTYGFNSIITEDGKTHREYNIDDLLKKFIIVFTFTENPDGRYYGSRRTSYGFDPNRDSGYQTQVESQYNKGAIAKWDPIAMLEFHGHYYELLLEPCTAPHDPNLEYDLLQSKMLIQAHNMGKAALGFGAFNRYSVVVEDYNSAGSFDDGSAMYSPIFALHYGTMGFTYETPNGNIEDVLTMQQAAFALMGNIYDDFDNYFANKIEYKRRGVENLDLASSVDPYFTTFEGEVVGRPREEGKNYFPEYYVLPIDTTNQKNVLESYKMVQYLTRNQVKVEKTTQTVTVEEKIYPVGTYIVNMHQGNRDIANTMLAVGYDASTYKTRPYAEIIMDFPDMRGFDAIPVHTVDAFESKTIPANFDANTKVIVDWKTNIKSDAIVIGTGENVIIKNNNIDSVNLVVKALQNGATVNMLDEDARPNGIRGDFYMSMNEFNTYKKGLYVEAKAIAPLASTAYKPLKLPKFRVYGSANESAFVFEMLGFRRDIDFKYGAIDGQNAIVAFNDKTNVAANIDAGMGYVGIGTALDAAKSNNYLGTGLDYKTGSNSRFEGIVKGIYANDSIVTANYDRMDRMYTVNSMTITAVPAKAKILQQVMSDPINVGNGAVSDSFFMAGWYYNDKANLQGKVLAVTGNYQGDPNKPAVTLFANNIINKAHGQFQFNMLANAIFIASSDISPTLDVNVSEVSIRTEQETKVGDLLEFNISLAKMANVMNMTITFEVDSDELEYVESSALNGFDQIAPIDWKMVEGTNKIEGKVTLIPKNVSEGITSIDKLDILKVSYSSNLPFKSSTSMKIKSVKITSWNESKDSPFTALNIIDPDTATTKIVKTYGKYNLNNDLDENCDGADLAITQRYYRSQLGDANWNQAKVADVNGDSIVNMLDLMIIFMNYTK